MRSRSVHNRRPSQAYAVLVAFLYVFLCTFGTLTHSHGDSDASVSALQISASGGSQTSAQIGGHGSRLVAASVPTHCAFCDWEASSVSVALLPVSLTGPITVGYLPVPERTPFPITFASRASSRGPPAV